MAKQRGDGVFNPGDTTTFIRNALMQARKVKDDFASEIHQAEKLHARARDSLARVFNDMRQGRALDLQDIRSIVLTLYDHLQRNCNTMLWLTNLRLHNEGTACHSFNIAVLAMNFGKHRGMSKSDIIALGMGGMLHDLGKTRIPPVMLEKPEPLTTDEYELVRHHADDGYTALEASGQLPKNTLDIVRYHHERCDGRGYPEGLSGDSIPELARMVAIADAYDSMIGDYGYRQPMTPTAALHSLINDAGEEFGQDLVEQFIGSLGTYPVGSVLELNSGALMLVVASNPEARLKPTVLQLRSDEGKYERPRMLFDLAQYSDVESMEQWGIRGFVDPLDIGIDLPAIVFEETLN